MKKSTRALVGMVVLDAIILAGAWWMLMDLRRDPSSSFDPAESGRQIGQTAGMAVGIITAILLVAFIYHRRRGN
jgi:hypothetical protein